MAVPVAKVLQRVQCRGIAGIEGPDKPTAHEAVRIGTRPEAQAPGRSLVAGGVAANSGERKSLLCMVTYVSADPILDRFGPSGRPKTALAPAPGGLEGSNVKKKRVNQARI